MEKQTLSQEPSAVKTTGQDADASAQGRIDHSEEAAKAIRFMAIKAAIFILIPVIASALAVFFLL